MSKEPIQHRVGPDTARLRLRAFEPTDAEVFRVLSSDADITRYTGDASNRTLKECREAIITYPDFRVHGFGRWACVLKTTDQVIGMAGLKYLEEWNVVDLGYRLLAAYWGRGLATEAGAACLDFAFDRLALPEVHGFVHPDNRASSHVLEKLSMRYLGLVDYDGDPTKRYVVTAGQWRARTGS